MGTGFEHTVCFRGVQVSQRQASGKATADAHSREQESEMSSGHVAVVRIARRSSAVESLVLGGAARAALLDHTHGALTGLKPFTVGFGL